MVFIITLQGSMRRYIEKLIQVPLSIIITDKYNSSYKEIDAYKSSGALETENTVDNKKCLNVSLIISFKKINKPYPVRRSPGGDSSRSQR